MTDWLAFAHGFAQSGAVDNIIARQMKRNEDRALRRDLAGLPREFSEGSLFEPESWGASRLPDMEAFGPGGGQRPAAAPAAVPWRNPDTGEVVQTGPAPPASGRPREQDLSVFAPEVENLQRAQTIAATYGRGQMAQMFGQRAKMLQGRIDQQRIKNKMMDVRPGDWRSMARVLTEEGQFEAADSVAENGLAREKWDAGVRLQTKAEVGKVGMTFFQDVRSVEDMDGAVERFGTFIRDYPQVAQEFFSIPKDQRGYRHVVGAKRVGGNLVPIIRNDRTKTTGPQTANRGDPAAEVRRIPLGNVPRLLGAYVELSERNSKRTTKTAKPTGIFADDWQDKFVKRSVPGQMEPGAGMGWRNAAQTVGPIAQDLARKYKLDPDRAASVAEGAMQEAMSRVDNGIEDPETRQAFIDDFERTFLKGFGRTPEPPAADGRARGDLPNPAEAARTTGPAALERGSMPRRTADAPANDATAERLGDARAGGMGRGVPNADAMQRTQNLLNRLTTTRNRSPEDLFGGPRPDRQPDPFFGATIGDEGDDRGFIARMGDALSGVLGGPDLDRMPGINPDAPAPQAGGAPAQQSAGRANRQLVTQVIQAESGGDATAVSPKGAVGLMQIMPESAMDPGFGVSNIFELADQAGRPYKGRTKGEAKRLLRDPILNQAIGTQYLNAMIRRFNGDMVRALVAYNWGPENARQWDGDMASLPDETRAYVTRIMGSMEREPDLAALG